MDRAVRPLPECCRPQQDGRAVLRWHSTARRRQLARRCPPGLPNLKGGRRELLRRRVMQPAIYGLEGFALNEDERALYRDAEAAGFILFRRNCENQHQLLRLTDSL